MLVLILIDVQYSQKAVFSFEKGSDRQNNSSSGSHHPVTPPSPSKIPHTPHRYLENPVLSSTYEKPSHVPFILDLPLKGTYSVFMSNISSIQTTLYCKAKVS